MRGEVVVRAARVRRMSAVVVEKNILSGQLGGIDSRKRQN